MTTVLVVDDDRTLLRALSIGLKAHGYHVAVADDGPSAVAQASAAHPDAILLDLGLPGLTGIEVLEAVRGWSNTPVIVLSARDQDVIKVAALDAGADDYVTKPFGMDELLARIRAVLRRKGGEAQEGIVEAGSLRIDLGARRVEREGEFVHLTPKEWGALAKLVRNPGLLVTQHELLAEVWGPGSETESEYLRTVFARLRRKLEHDPSAPRHLITEPGIGYRFEP